MTQSEQVEVVREKINFEKEFLDYQIKKRNKARKEFEDCLIEECQEKQLKLDRCYTAVSNQYMYLCGVLATAYELKLISKDERDKLQKQVFDEAFN